MRYCISGGDALPDKIRAAFELVYRRKICNGYGMTETSPFIAADFDDELKPTNTVGTPALGIECSLRDEEGKDVGAGQIGILWIKGQNVMLGYYNAPEQTNAILKDGWLNTGDFAYFDQKGRIVMAGRHKDVLSSKGIKIYPQEIENIIMLHPAVLFVGVIGVPEENVGEVPVAFVSLREHVENIEQQLKKLCIEHLAAYKIPKKFIVVKDMPVTSLGKVDKKRLRVEYGSKI